MFLEIPDLLQPNEIERLRAIAAEAKFVDGRISNPHSTAKNNLQLDRASPLFQESSSLVMQAFTRSAPFREFALPRRIAAPLLARYEPGMTYGIHSDAAIMPLQPVSIRADLSCTVFIAAPDSYEGGELVSYIGDKAVGAKGVPGSAIVYPSTTLHEVRPVTKGQRLVSITFIESYVADPGQREILFALNEVSAEEGLKIDWRNRARLEFARNNLIRMWSS